MKVLILDNSTHSPFLAQLSGQKIVTQLSAPLFPTLQNFCDLDTLDLIAVGIGPGSYMGMRSAVTIAKALSYAKGIPLVEFPSPLAYLTPGYQGHFAFIGDAKMGQFFLLTGTVYPNQVPTISAPQLVSPEDLALEGFDFIVGPNHLPPTLNLEWLPLYLSQQKTLDANSLALTYLR